MTLLPNIVNDIVCEELKECASLQSESFCISPYDERSQIFTVHIKSKIDDEEYFLEVKCDNYNELPPYLEFLDPSTGVRGTKNAYPFYRDDSFFHTVPCICNPCSRKAYEKDMPHSNWNMIGWKEHDKVNSLNALYTILKAISHRVNNSTYYTGRMKQ